jgi:membrane-bound metal-dependent hydrolase YbcI (DUF457 family)
VVDRKGWIGILFSPFIGVYSHVFLDSFVVMELQPFYPLQVDPFISISSVYLSSSIVCEVCSVTRTLGVALYWFRTGRRAVVKGESTVFGKLEAKRFRA